MLRDNRAAKRKADKKAAELRADPPKNVRKAKQPAQVMLKELARIHTDEVLKELLRLARRSKSDVVRLQAIEQILNRGWGKAVQPVGGGPEGEGAIPIIMEVRRTLVRPPKRTDD